MTSPYCSIFLDDEPLATDAQSLSNRDITVLDGLSVKWGRSTRLDQPDPTTLTASIALPDDERARDALEKIAPGRRISVTATSPEAPADADSNILLPERAWDATTRLSVWSLFLDKTPAHVLAPQRSFIDGNDNPAAWNTLATVVAGQSFTTLLRMSIPPWTSVTVTPAYWKSPVRDDYQLDLQKYEIKSAPTFQATDAVFAWRAPASAVGTYVGLKIDVTGHGARFKDLTSAFSDTPQEWESFKRLSLGSLSITSTSTGARTATVFDGRITSAITTWDEHLSRPVLRITGADVLTTLANKVIGAEPWPTETLSTRLARIVDATDVDLSVVADPVPGAMLLRARDVDAAGLLDLIRESATSTGAILWPSAARGIGQFLYLEDQRNRKSLYTLRIPQTGNAWTDVNTRTNQLPASGLLRAGVNMCRDTTDLATEVIVRWESAILNENQELEWATHEERATDPERVATYGARTLSISTQLTSQAEAIALAVYYLTATAPGGWTIPAITLNDALDVVPTRVLMSTLDASTRIGLPIVITDCADWIPGSPNIPVYLDGGTITREHGHWVHDLTLTRASTASHSTTWKEMPLHALWNQFPNITWAEIGSTSI